MPLRDVVSHWLQNRKLAHYEELGNIIGSLVEHYKIKLVLLSGFFEGRIDELDFKLRFQQALEVEASLEALGETLATKDKDASAKRIEIELQTLKQRLKEQREFLLKSTNAHILAQKLKEEGDLLAVEQSEVKQLERGVFGEKAASYSISRLTGHQRLIAPAAPGIPNKFLSQVMRTLRSQLKPQDERDKPRIAGHNFIYGRFQNMPYELPLIYFESKGCRYDKAGACTMCNFGRGAWYADTEIFDAIKRELDQFKGAPSVFITPAGSFLDDGEVSPVLRRRILNAIVENGTKLFSTESRAEFITEDKIKEIKKIAGEMDIEMGLGLETSNPLIANYCINKISSTEKYTRAVRLLKKYNIEVFTHVLLKPAFVTEREAYEDALQTILWAFSQGSDMVGIGLMNIKKGTLNYWLSERGLYTPPTYWTVLKIIQNVPKDLRNRVTLFGFESSTKMYGMAGNCDICTQHIKRLLFSYLGTRDESVLAAAANYDCECKEAWKQEMQSTATPLTERLPKIYSMIAKELFGKEWAEKNSVLIEQSLPSQQ